MHFFQMGQNNLKAGGGGFLKELSKYSENWKYIILPKVIASQYKKSGEAT